MSIGAFRVEEDVYSMNPVLQINGEIRQKEDAERFQEILDDLLREINEWQFSVVTLSFLGLDNLTPAEVGKLVKFWRALSKLGTRLKLVANTHVTSAESPYQMLQMVGFDDVYSSIEDAVSDR